VRQNPEPCGNISIKSFASTPFELFESIDIAVDLGYFNGEGKNENL
jgi:hypothetical protein